MNFEEPDDVPEDRLNRILWHQERGWDVPYPGTRHTPGIKQQAGEINADTQRGR
jgi:hypothetical protein